MTVPGAYNISVHATDAASRSDRVATVALNAVGFATPSGWDPRDGWGNSTSDRVIEAGVTYDVPGVLDSTDAVNPFMRTRGALSFEAEVPPNNALDSAHNRTA